MTSQYLNVHLLTPTAMANANRDDTGAPKSAVYGGVQRLRWSSQSQKRAKRVSFETASPVDRSIRSKNSAHDVALRAASGDNEVAEKLLPQAQRLVDRLTQNLKKAEDKKNAKKPKSETNEENEVAEDTPTDNKKEAKDTLVWLSHDELDDLARKLVDSEDDSEMVYDFLSTTPSLAIAAFGRMFAQQPQLEMEAACAVAHAITTHEAVTEIDYFTAVDDQPTVDTGKGAGHIGLRQYGSGVFYSYLCLDRRQLHANWMAKTSNDASQRLALLWHALLCATPTGMNANAPIGGVPSFIYAVESDAPATLVGAFERPVEPTWDSGSGLLTPSIERFAQWAGAVGRFAGPAFGSSWLGVSIPDDDVDLSPLPVTKRCPTLDELVQNLSSWASQP